MRLTRRAWCLASGAACAGALLPASAIRCRPRWLADGADDPRGNLRGWSGLGWPACRPADLRGESGPVWLAIPAETCIEAPLVARLAARVQQGGVLLWEAPALAAGTAQATWEQLAGGRADRAPRNLFAVSLHPDAASPYLRLRLGARHWWLRHDSEVIALSLPPGARGQAIVSDDVGTVYGWLRPWGAGRLACLGTRLGAPAARGDATVREFLRVFWLA